MDQADVANERQKGFKTLRGGFSTFLQNTHKEKTEKKKKIKKRRKRRNKKKKKKNKDYYNRWQTYRMTKIKQYNRWQTYRIEKSGSTTEVHH